MRILVILLLLPALCYTQSVQVLMQEGAVAEAAFEDELAYKKYLQAVRLEPANLQVLLKCSELAGKVGHRMKSKEDKLRYYQVAHRYAALALKLSPNSADANFFMSVAKGRLAQVASGRLLVESVKDIKRYADKAVRLSPGDYRPWHVLGKWYYEIAALGSVKRTAVKLFYGAFPEASYQDAITHYERSRQLNPSFNLNYLELAKVYHKTGQETKAMELLKTLERLPIRMEDDKRIREEGRQLWGEYNR